MTKPPSKNLFNRRTFHVLLTSAALASTQGAYAQSPAHDKPLKVILPLSAGSTVDAIARGMNAALTRALDRPVYIENLPGAGGVTGTQQIARAAKDGSVIGMVSNNFAVNPSIYRKMPFDSTKDIAPVTVIGQSPFVLVVNRDVQASSVKELVALAKSKPGALNYGSSGNGTILHLAGEYFVHEAKVDIRHIAYKGNGPLVNDLLGGQVQMAFIGTTVAEAHVKAGALKAIGISTKERSALMPQVPTIAEQGLANFDIGGWIAVVAPAGTPSAMLSSLNKSINSVVNSAETSEWLASQDFRPVAEDLDRTQRFFKREFEKTAALVKQSGATLD